MLNETLTGFLMKRYHPEDGGLTPDYGNADDSYSNGYACGYASALYQLAQAMGLEVEPLAEQLDPGEW